MTSMKVPVCISNLVTATYDVGINLIIYMQKCLSSISAPWSFTLAQTVCIALKWASCYPHTWLLQVPPQHKLDSKWCPCICSWSSYHNTCSHRVHHVQRYHASCICITLCPLIWCRVHCTPPCYWSSGDTTLLFSKRGEQVSNLACQITEQSMTISCLYEGCFKQCSIWAIKFFFCEW